MYFYYYHSKIIGRKSVVNLANNSKHKGSSWLYVGTKKNLVEIIINEKTVLLKKFDFENKCGLNK